MERQALRGARPDPRQPRQLRDEVVDGRAEHSRSVLSVADYRPGSPSPDIPGGNMPFNFDSTSDCAERRASLTAAMTMSARSSGSSGSIAAGSIAIDTTSPPPF